LIIKPLNLGVIGGSVHSSVGRTHHTASQLDGCFKITTGCFSKSSKHNQETAKSLNISHSKTYTDWKKFIISEKNNIDAILLLTPTPLHAEMAIEVVKHNIPLICEKALCTSKKEAIKILRQ
jgi:predicted dehydrogenase